MEVTIVRHTSVDVAPGTCYGQTDLDVASTFAAEAACVRQRLAGLAYDMVCCSPLRRCLKLAAACGYDAPLIDDRLMELNFGRWEMQRWEDIGDPRLQEYYADFEHVAPTGGESLADQCKRVRAAFDEMAGKVGAGGRVLVFAHGGVAVCALMAARGLSVVDAFGLEPKCGEAVTIWWP